MQTCFCISSYCGQITHRYLTGIPIYTVISAREKMLDSYFVLCYNSHVQKTPKYL